MSHPTPLEYFRELATFLRRDLRSDTSHRSVGALLRIRRALPGTASVSDADLVRFFRHGDALNVIASEQGRSSWRELEVSIVPPVVVAVARSRIGIVPGRSYELLAPDGSEIRGTYERTEGRANTFGARVNTDGSLIPAYTGDTDLFWDNQVTVYQEGQRVWLDEHGRTWLESQLFLVPDDSLDDGSDDLVQELAPPMRDGSQAPWGPYSSGRLLLPSPMLRSFFEAEIRNEAHGGVSPATLSSAWQSLSQESDEVLSDRFGFSDALVKFPYENAARELRYLIADWGLNASLLDVLSQSESSDS
jgi:hypothetical protein